MIYIFLIISFLLDGFILSIINSTSLLFPLCSIMSLIIIYPFFKKDEFNTFLIISGFVGMLYDVVYTGTLFLNIGVLILVAIIIKLIFRVFSNNLLSNILIGISIIVIYRTINYLVFSLAGYLDFSFLELLKGIYSSLIVNTIYIVIFYLIGILISKRFKIQRFS